MHEIQTEAMMDETRGVAEPAMRTAGNRKLCSYKQLSKETMLVLKQQGCMNTLNDGKLSHEGRHQFHRGSARTARTRQTTPAAAAAAVRQLQVCRSDWDEAISGTSFSEC
jgi:hypothetical protein